MRKSRPMRRISALLKPADRNLLLKLYFTLGSMVLLTFFLLYTHILIDAARKEADVVPTLLGRYFSLIGSDEQDQPMDFGQILFTLVQENLLSRIDYPLIITDGDREPSAWRNIPDVPDGFSLAGLSPAQRDILYANVKSLANHSEIYMQDTGETVGFAFYGEPKSVIYLRYMPYFDMLLVALFGIFGIYGIILVKRSEKDLLWVGLAKETAHQFGTPISSLIAWLDLLRMRIETNCSDPEMVDMVDDMRADVIHLQKVANRFGKVGSTISPKPTDLHAIIEQTIEYFNKRLPNLENEIALHFISKIEGRSLRVDPDLFRWTLENLLKNSIDAMRGRGGNIIIDAYPKDRWIYIHVRDEGVGMPKSQFSKVFEPGITSKSRGWGLGLSLAKRIVEDFHNGRIKVLESTLNEGTVIEIALPES
ncbi:MAG: HAMP domain-containing histidine kinase [Candidatus Cloacimonetes bacterium]|nr:HAMP domain-containing histidine kinase [Candidatus Cloacimonadota bacterium]